jgi:hypothetical protein
MMKGGGLMRTTERSTKQGHPTVAGMIERSMCHRKERIVVVGGERWQ